MSTVMFALVPLMSVLRTPMFERNFPAIVGAALVSRAKPMSVVSAESKKSEALYAKPTVPWVGSASTSRLYVRATTLAS